ncbi:MAG: rod shape-determining protein MreD [Bacteroidota bacterium]
MNRYIKFSLISLGLILIQTTLVHLVNLEGIVPDLLAIWIIYIALMTGQMEATIWGFGIGLLFDFTTHDFIGLSALSQTICGFLAGYFFNQNKTKMMLGSYRFILIVFFVTLVQNIIYFVIFTRGSEIDLLHAIFQFGLTTALYTSIITLFPVLIISRKPSL